MLECPFEIVSCSWPFPFEHVDRTWLSEPVWDAPLMPSLPQPRREVLQQDELCWSLNWSDFFGRCEMNRYPATSGFMRGFHLIFHVQIKEAGTLIIWDDNATIVRRNSQIIYCCRTASTFLRHEIEVQVGDCLEIAQGHFDGEWQWHGYLKNGAGARNACNTIPTPSTVLLPYRDKVQQQLLEPNGPALKMFTHGQSPLRSVVAIYSMVLRGYVPTAIYLFGEHQWSNHARRVFEELLPFATVVSTQQLVERIASLGVPKLVEMALQHWYVMKACSALLHLPDEFCQMDDDIFMLKCPQEALYALQEHDLVYAPDIDVGDEYIEAWRSIYELSSPLPTRRFNAGLYWMRNTFDPYWLAAQAARVQPGVASRSGFIVNEVLWEQGFIATTYARKNTLALPSQRYFFPMYEGLPGGALGYDYANNPCGFTSIHFAGLTKKPSDGITLHLLLQLLGPAPHPVAT